MFKFWANRQLGRLVLKYRHITFHYKITFEGKLPKIHIPKRYEQVAKWALRIITVMGILLDWIGVENPFIKYPIPVVIVLVEQILEKLVFIYTTIFIEAIPENFSPSDWMATEWRLQLSEGILFSVSLLFRTRDSAISVFECLKAWNNNKENDFENDIQLSVIIDSD